MSEPNKTPGWRLWPPERRHLPPGPYPRWTGLGALGEPKMWTERAATWIERVKSIIDDAAGLHHDLGTVVYRIERDKGRFDLEPGCAYRLIRLASTARLAGQRDIGERAHALAAEVISAERDPDPDWATMCDEEGWPHGT